MATIVQPNTPLDTLRREDLFRNPPKDKSAFPALLNAVKPHIESFNAITAEGGLLDLARQDIGVKCVFDGKGDGKGLGNKLSRELLLYICGARGGVLICVLVRIDKIYVGKPKISERDKTTLRREIFPAECRERHITYRGKLSVKLGLKINDGPWVSQDREVGNIPIMVRVCVYLLSSPRCSSVWCN